MSYRNLQLNDYMKSNSYVKLQFDGILRIKTFI